MSSYRTVHSFDTEYSADAVEWCPAEGRTDLLAVGTYQVDKSDEEKFSADQRKGRIYLMRMRGDEALEVAFRMETAAVLDMKWSPRGMDADLAVLAAVDAKGDLALYKLVVEEGTSAVGLKMVGTCCQWGNAYYNRQPSIGL